MTFTALAAKVGAAKTTFGIIGFSAAVLLVLSGWLKTPAKTDAIAAAIEDHTQQTDRTNRKLDVLICLQAKLDTPINCVHKESERK